MYTDNHLRYVAASLIKLYKQRNNIQGLKRVYATKLLSHFTARFEPMEKPVNARSLTAVQEPEGCDDDDVQQQQEQQQQ